MILPLAFLVLAACDSDDSSSGGKTNSTTDQPSTKEVFSKYCTGILKNDTTGMLPSGPFGWMSSNTKKKDIPAGTEILLEYSFSRTSGYAIFSDGSASKVSNQSLDGLIKDTDYTSDCPTSGKTERVLLMDSTFFANQELTGQPCTVKAGTILDSASATESSDGKYTSDVAKVKSAQIKEICGLDVAYSSDGNSAELLLK